MLSDEEKEALEQAIGNLIRGVDIESAMLILEKCALDGLIITRGRINIFKIAVRQIVEFIKEYKDKGYLDVVREKVKANDLIKKQSKEIEELKEQCKEVVCVPEGTCFMIEPKNIDKKWKDKIKAKIEEYKQMAEATKLDKTWYGDNRRDTCEEIIAVLQSLLEKE